MAMRLRSLVSLLAVTYFGLSYIFISNLIPRYGTNDDFFFNDLLAGSFTGEPTPFINLSTASPRILFSLPVWALFKITNEINWYIFVLLAIVVVALAVINAAIFQLATKRHKLILFGASNVVGVFFLLWWAVSPTYTAAAFVPSIAAGSLLLLGSSRPGNLKVRYIFTAGIFLAIAMSIRTESALIPAITLIFPALTKILMSSDTKKYRNLILFIALVLLAHAVNVLTQFFVLKSSEEWVNYSKFESVRYQIHGNNKYERLLTNFSSQLGWDKSKTELFLTYDYADREIYTSDEMLKLEENLELFEDNTEIRWVDIERRIDTHVGQFRDLWILAILFSATAIIVYRTKKVLILLLYANISFIVVSLYILVNLRTPERIVVPALVSLLLSIITLSGTEKREESLKLHHLLLQNVVPIALIMIFLAPTFLFQSQRSSVSMFSDFAYTQESELLNLGKTAIFFGNASQFRWDWTNPYKFESPQYISVPTGWYTFSPPWNEKVRNLGFSEASLYSGLPEQTDVFFLANELTTQNLTKLYRDELNTEIEFTLVFEKSFDFGSYNVYVIRGGSSVG